MNRHPGKPTDEEQDAAAEEFYAIPERKSEDEIARYYWPPDLGDIPAWFRSAISDAVDSGIALAVRRSR
jgi:hypothetical protein